ncbi:zinc finger C2HC domain-containing protein 1A-like isoform X2 [Ptychodera flava]|uniref:zinc finger C2HC domain-containing protein 1A-like isoform X2 n=1 Tax=Ptychodera flava TaxID=63121 RepID=UPI00396A7F78
MEYEAFGGSGNAGEVIPCQVCGRNFNPESLVKHERICRKVQVNSRKRKTFDSGKQRAKGTEIPISKTVRPGQQPKPQPVKQTNWRQKHQDFINAVRSARGVSHAMKTGAPLPPPPPPSVNPDFVECPTCNRRFNQKAAARHIPFCADRAKTFGAPVKPLQKRAAADVAGSTTGMRKAYDNKVVRKKPGSNPYAYADSQMYTSTFGQPGSQEYPSRGEPLGYGPGGGNVSISRHEGVGPKYSNARSASALKSSNRSQQSAQNRMRATGHIRFADQDGEALTSDILAHQGANVSWHGNQGAYRTTKASQARQQQSQQKRFSVAKNKGQAEQPTFETTIPLDENLTPRHDLAQQGMSPATRHHPMQSPSSTNVRRLPQMSPKTMSPKPSPNATLNGNSGGKPSPFCHGCGTKYPVEDARFCCSCGSKRAYLT